VPAAKVLLAYVVGKPAEAIDPDRLDLDEFRLLAESPQLQEAEAAEERLTPDYAARLARETQGGDAHGHVRLLKQSKEKLLGPGFGMFDQINALDDKIGELGGDDDD
jgi:hypothetical protein